MNPLLARVVLEDWQTWVPVAAQRSAAARRRDWRADIAFFRRAGMWRCVAWLEQHPEAG